ncbi:MAG: arsenate reductase ArsC [Acidobacteria bacterium]|nr:arsenate reductase ArsC [Acidobacteriota bacterium]
MKKLRILFVCVGNACRSQMAEGFAKHLGADIVEAHSAGMMPLGSVPSQTRKVMLEKDAPIDDQFPKGVEVYRNTEFDLVINMSGIILPKGLKEKERRWTVGDPYGSGDGEFRQVRDDIEARVRELLQQVRDAKGDVPAPAPPKRGLFGFGKS